MKNQNLIRILIIILAVVSIGLAALYASQQIGGTDSTGELPMDGIANYGTQDDPSSQNSSYGGVTVVSGTDGNYTVTDDGTVEMDSIPNDVSTPVSSASDAE